MQCSPVQADAVVGCAGVLHATSSWQFEKGPGSE